MATPKPSPYVPSFIKSALSGSRPLTLTWSDVSDTNISSTSSFQYDPHTTALKSSQQLNVDWSQFSNHTFFMSAEAKVNIAFDTIINGFPFDGSRRETEAFFEKLTGFDRWVFNEFPRYRGALAFVGSTGGGAVEPETGTFIEVKNRTGAMFPELAKDSTSRPVLSPSGSHSLTIEMQLFLPSIENDVQVVCQMVSGTSHGFSFHLLENASTSSCVAQFCVVSGTSHMSVPVELIKGTYNHVALVFNRDEGVPYLESFRDAETAAVSSTRVSIGDLGIDASSFMIGSGTVIDVGSTQVIPASTLSGTIDEFRMFHSVRTSRQQALYAKKSLFSTDDLVLYLRFNEPPPPISLSDDDDVSSIVIDHSGHALHSMISNFTGSLRLSANDDPLNPVSFEHPDTTVVLFPAHPDVVALNESLLQSASLYDAENPNLITKLVPQHYFLEGALQDGFDEIEGTFGLPYAGSGIPGQGQLGNVQIMVSLLYIWARFFDELKLFVDSFSTLKTVAYDTDETIPDNFLTDMVKSFGFNLPPLFNDSTVEQYVRGENVDLRDITSNDHSLRYVQNTLLRRVLVNLPDVLRSKGTQHSIKSFLRSVGIDPGNTIRIREFGGPTTQQLSFSREKKIELGTMTQFTTSSTVTSPFLRAERVEPGYPEPNGTLDDELLTSGSWTWEGIVKYTPASLLTMSSSTQSLVRLCVTGSVTGSSFGSSGIVANLVAISSSITPQLVLYARPGDSDDSPLLTLAIDMPAPGLFNHDKWNVSFGCRRGDDGLDSVVSSSYFLRLAYQNDGQIEYMRSTSSFFLENPTGNNVMRTFCDANASGTFIEMGPRAFHDTGTGSQYPHLNDNSRVPEGARATDFCGRLSNVRFWSKAVTDSEWREHVRNYTSTGVEDPHVNWNYVTNASGSFERLRMNSMIKQDVRRAIGTASVGELGTITFIDFSESGFHLTGSGFPIEEDCVVADVFEVNQWSPYFDEASTDEKVRVRSYQDQELVDSTPWAAPAPVHEIVPSERPTDDVRFTIEFSLVDALNRDIVTMFATLDAIDNALGAPELLFSPDYPDLEHMRNVYFNRIKDKLNFQAFFEFYRWFDTSIGTFVNQLVPRKTRFRGTNFTIESHMLERSKQQYHFNEMYIGDSMRQNLNAVILLQQVVGTMRKY